MGGGLFGFITANSYRWPRSRRSPGDQGKNREITGKRRRRPVRTAPIHGDNVNDVSWLWPAASLRKRQGFNCSYMIFIMTRRPPRVNQKRRSSCDLPRLRHEQLLRGTRPSSRHSGARQSREPWASAVHRLLHGRHCEERSDEAIQSLRPINFNGAFFFVPRVRFLLRTKTGLLRYRSQ
jgi:hypothetical protein